MPQVGIEPQFLGRPAHILVTIPTKLSLLLLLFEIFIIFSVSL